jgi:DNA polymerase-3 subunit beta
MTAGALPFRFRMATDDLKKLIGRTRFAISTEETRFYLNGIYLHAHKEGKREMRAVATDGHRLARFQMELPEGAADMPGIIVPRKAVIELARLLDDVEGGIDISLSDTKIQFATDGIELTSKLIDGTFPDYQRVIPTGNDKVLTLDAREFAAAVDRVSTISADKTRAVKLGIARDKLTLTVINPDSGTATEDVGASYSASPLEIGFNARYLLDITGQIEGKEVRFQLSDAGSPTLIEDAEDPGTLYVLMPMRV